MKNFLFLCIALCWCITSDVSHLVLSSDILKKASSGEKHFSDFPITNISNNSLSITFRLSDNSAQYSHVVPSNSNYSFIGIPQGTYTITISPAATPVNCTMTFNSGESYGPSPGHTFFGINVGSQTTSLNVY